MCGLEARSCVIVVRAKGGWMGRMWCESGGLGSKRGGEGGGVRYGCKLVEGGHDDDDQPISTHYSIQCWQQPTST